MGLFSGRAGLLARSLRGTEWSQFLDYVSPSFLDVMPFRHLLSQGKEMASNATQGRRFAEVRGDVEARLAKLGADVRLLEAPGDADVEALPEDDRRALGQRALEIYFGQLLSGPTTIVDLRAARFQAAPGDATPAWAPRPFWLAWDPEFLADVRELYTGFYRGDDRFVAALARLGLSAAEDVFRDHFGSGDQRAVRFSSEVFHTTFHEVFVRCRDDGATLHRNFLALGLYLACLYDLLEALDLEFDVRTAFDRVSGG